MTTTSMLTTCRCVLTILQAPLLLSHCFNVFKRHSDCLFFCLLCSTVSAPSMFKKCWIKKKKKHFPRIRSGRMFVFTRLGCYCAWQGYNSSKEFIAAQGPLPATVKCFWRMIWEKNVKTLVMLTRCNEQGRVSSTASTLPARRSSSAKARVNTEQQTHWNSNHKHIPWTHAYSSDSFKKGLAADVDICEV